MGILAVQAGPNDNVEDLKVALGNLDMNHSFLYAPVEVIEGEKKEDGIRDKLVTGVQTCALPI